MNEFAQFKMTDAWPKVKRFLAESYAQMVADSVQAADDDAALLMLRRAEGAGLLLRRLITAVEQREWSAQDEQVKITDVKKFVYDQIKGA